MLILLPFINIIHTEENTQRVSRGQMLSRWIVRHPHHLDHIVITMGQKNADRSLSNSRPPETRERGRDLARNILKNSTMTGQVILLGPQFRVWKVA